jgi:hypothetical protein
MKLFMTRKKSYFMANAVCPVCKQAITAAVPMESLMGKPGVTYRPEPGDITICAFCTSFLRFKEDLSLALLTEDEVADLPDEFRINLQRVRFEVIEIQQEKMLQDLFGK